MSKMYETPKLVVISFCNADIVTASTSPFESHDNAFKNPWEEND